MKHFEWILILSLTGILFTGCKGEEQVASEDPKQGRNFLYFDATANFGRFSHKDSILYFLQRSKDAGITDVVIDVKPISGEVLYPSKIAPVMTSWEGEWSSGEKDNSWDMLSVFIEEGHKLGLLVHVSTNIFVGGHNYFDRGLVYEDQSKAHWQTLSYLPEGLTPITEQKNKYSAMLNPALEEVQQYQLEILKELVSMYPELDGLILDRVRYDGITADFSEESRKLFENYIGKELKNFPGDIFSYNTDGSRVEGPMFKKWLEWRSGVIHDFMYEARDAVKEINKDLYFGDYTGSWYPSYYEVGVNWASKDYDPAENFEWATKDYKNTGYAEVLDIFLTGNYFYEVRKEEAKNIDTTTVVRNEAGQDLGREYWYTVEGSAELVNKVVKNKAPVYAGIYVEQYKNDPEQFIEALKMCRAKSNGAMIFDIVHIINKSWWNELERGLKE